MYFGFFQALMPVIGYFAGVLFAGKIQQYDHWIAFILLGSIGGKMIIGSFSREKEKTVKDPFNPGRMLALALATSIDALMVGVTFAFFKINLLLAIAIIGVTTFLLSAAGVKIGQLFGEKFKSKAELIGGIVLLLLGMRILIG
jgi:putative Mn2+ efflux pump MntP